MLYVLKMESFNNFINKRNSGLRSDEHSIKTPFIEGELTELYEKLGRSNYNHLHVMILVFAMTKKRYFKN